MRAVTEKIEAFRRFLSEVGSEMRKATWPDRQELIESTVVVIVSMLLMSAFVGLSDRLLITTFKLITPSG